MQEFDGYRFLISQSPSLPEVVLLQVECDSQVRAEFAMDADAAVKLADCLYNTAAKVRLESVVLEQN